MKKSEETRLLILQKAFDLVYANGYQATSIDDIIATTKVTKGAFFYHFKTKDEMGLALITEVMQPVVKEEFVSSLKSSHDPVKDIYKTVKHLLLENPRLIVKYGCPVGNLVQEMAPLSPVFSKALGRLVKQWQQVIEAGIILGKKSGAVRRDVKPEQVASLVMSGYWGIRHFGKLYGNNSCYKPYLKELKNYLESLR